MNLLLDTCTLIWLTSDPKKLSKTAISAMEKSRGALYVSDVTVLEISLKYTKGKIKLPNPPRNWIEEQLVIWELQELPLSRNIIYRSSELPLYHFDPFDRLLVGATLEHSLRIVTPDPAISQYPIPIIW